eukprot:gene5359-5895_t
MEGLSAGNKPLGAGPKTRVCYICGRQYGLHSYDIHLKQCKELWIARESQKDPRERKPLPEDPALRLAGRKTAAGGDDDDVGGGSPVKSAGGGGGGEPSLDEINRMASEAFNSVALSQCAYCGRTFLPEKLAIHNKSCTADNPARRVDEGVRKGKELTKVSTATATASPERPVTKQARREASSSVERTIEKEQQQEEEEEERSQVVPMAGEAGRGLRKAKLLTSPKKTSRSSTSTSTSQQFASKEEALVFVSEQVQAMESALSELISSMAEVKATLAAISSMP